MSKAVLSTIAAALAFAGSALFPGSCGAQVVPSTKVSSALAPLFAKEQKTQANSFLPALTALTLEALLKGRQISGGIDLTRHSQAQAYHLTPRSVEVNKALKGVIETGVMPGEQLWSLRKRLEAVEAK